MRLNTAGNNGLLPGSATVLVCGLGLKLPFSLDRVGPGVKLGDLPCWRLPVPIIFGPIPPPHDLLEKGMATHSTIFAWRIPWTKEPGGLQSMGSERVGHD